MLSLEAKGAYADVMERALYNGVISGMQLDGKKFFYVNPLEVLPEASLKDQRKRHVKVERQRWFGCACCPPNIIRLVSSLEDYICSASERELYVHLYVRGALQAEIDGKAVRFEVDTEYPWKGDVALTYRGEERAAFALKLRVPGWCRSHALSLNGAPLAAEVKDGYATVQREWQDGDRLTLALDMPVTLVRANPRIYEDAGKVAVQRGPLVYCLEEADNGPQLHLLKLPGDAVFETEDIEICGQKMTGLKTMGLRRIPEERALEGQHSSLAGNGSSLYHAYKKPVYEQQELHFVPYFAWGNRGENEMSVWVNIG
jgi:DUF1680 family protein